MELKFETKDVVTKLAQVASVVSGKASLPILDNIMLKASDDTLSMMGSDGEMWLSAKCPLLACDESLSICVNASDLLKALKNLGECEVTFTIDSENHNLTCNYGNGRFTLPCSNAKEYPLPQMDMSGSIEKAISNERLLRAIDKTLFAIANDDLRPVMNGIHFDFFKDSMTCASSDGHKLARYRDASIVSEESESVDSFTMPTKVCNAARNILATSMGDFSLRFTDKCVVLSNDVFGLSARLIDGRYPNYNSVIPTTHNVSSIVDKATMIGALKRVLPMGSANSELISLTFKDNNIKLVAEDLDFQKSASENIECDYSPRFDPITIGFKGSTLLQLFMNLDGDKAQIELLDANRAAVIYDNDKDVYLSLIMPMLLN